MSKSRQNSNVPNRLSVADRAELLTKTGTREGEVILQRDIGLLYAWTDTQGTDNGGTILNVATGSWLAQYSGAINVTWFGAVGDGATDDRVAIQSAINSSNNVYIPSGTFLLSSSGVTNVSYEYALLVRSNLTITGQGMGTILKTANTSNTVVIKNDETSLLSNFTLKDIYIDGNSANNLAVQTPAVYLKNTEYTTLLNIRVFDAPQFGIRIDDTNHFNVSGIYIYGGDDSRDGFHMFDCAYGTINNVNIDTAGDDGFIITSEGQASHDISASNIVVTAPVTGIEGGRGILLNLGDVPEAVGTEHEMYNISIQGVVRNCKGAAVTFSYGRYYNINIDVIDYGSLNALNLVVGSANVVGHIRNCAFNITSYNPQESSTTMTITSGVIENNTLNLKSINPADTFVGATIRGTKWSGNVLIDYDPSATKISPTHALDMYASLSELSLNIDGGTNNLNLRSGADNNVFTSVILVNSVTNSIGNVSGALSNTVNSGYVDALPAGIVGLVLGKVSGLYGEGKTTATTSAGGLIIVPHGMLGTPQIALANIFSTSAHIATIQSLDATNIGVLVRDYAGAAIASTSVTVMWQASYT